MTDTNRNDPRSDLEQIVESRSDAADAAKGGANTSPLDKPGVDDGVSGSRGEVKNQDVTQQ